MSRKLIAVAEASARILAGETLLVAGEERLLRQLPKGRWIGGTIPYFMADDGGEISQEAIYVDTIPDEVIATHAASYTAEQLSGLVGDAPENGFSIIILPAFSSAHQTYAQDAPGYDGLYTHPIIGWIAGVHLDDLGRLTAKVFDGQTGEAFEDRAVVLHCVLPPGRLANIDIVNVFEPGDGDTLTFEETAFSATDAFVNGERRNLAEYLTSIKADAQLPLVADYCGAMVNTSFQTVDVEAGRVDFYAPVFRGIEYKLARPLDDYVAAFTAAVPERGGAPVFACNCILNFLYSELEGKKTGNVKGPMTFGEVAYQLLNQTMVYLDIL
jgi:hypothetical protein